MKRLISLLSIILFCVSGLSANNFGEKEKKTKQKHYSNELKNLFNQNIEGLIERGSVIALVKIDSLGIGKVIESNSSTAILDDYVRQKIENKHFNQIKDSLIQLKVVF